MHHTEVENTGLRKLVKLKEREHTKIKRLQFIAKQCPSLAVEALKYVHPRNYVWQGVCTTFCVCVCAPMMCCGGC